MNENEIALRFGYQISLCSVDNEDPDELKNTLMGLIQHNLISGLPVSQFKFSKDVDSNLVRLGFSIYNAFARHEIDLDVAKYCRKAANDSSDNFSKSAWLMIAKLGESEEFSSTHCQHIENRVKDVTTFVGGIIAFLNFLPLLGGMMAAAGVIGFFTGSPNALRLLIVGVVALLVKPTIGAIFIKILKK